MQIYLKQLMQEKNELREERASLKADIENLNAQYRQKARAMFPWSYCCNTSTLFTPGSRSCSSRTDSHSSLIAAICLLWKSESWCHCQSMFQHLFFWFPFSSKQDSRSKLTDHQRGKNKERCDELKMPVPPQWCTNTWQMKTQNWLERFVQDIPTGEREGN